MFMRLTQISPSKHNKNNWVYTRHLLGRFSQWPPWWPSSIEPPLLPYPLRVEASARPASWSRNCATLARVFAPHRTLSASPPPPAANPAKNNGESFHWDEISLGKQSSRRFSGFARRNVLNEFTSRERLFFPQLLELFSGRWSGCPKGMIPSHWENNSRKWARDDIYFLRKIYLRKFENLCIYIYICRNWGKKEFC